MAGASERVGYRRLYPVVNASLGFINRTEQQVFGERSFDTWWWQEGPVDNCCCCFPLRTGIVLISLDNLLSGMMKVFAEKLVVQRIDSLEREYGSVCSRWGQTHIERCKMLAEEKAEAEFITSCKLLLYHEGFALVFFSLVGIKAASTGNPTYAKVYLAIYPFMVVCGVVVMTLRVVTAPSTLTPAVLTQFCLEMVFLAYYLKVSWSYYKRRKVMEEMQLVTETSVQGHTTTNIPVTEVPMEEMQLVTEISVQGDPTNMSMTEVPMEEVQLVTETSVQGHTTTDIPVTEVPTKEMQLVTETLVQGDTTNMSMTAVPMEEMQLVTETSVQGHTTNMPVTEAPTVV